MIMFLVLNQDVCLVPNANLVFPVLHYLPIPVWRTKINIILDTRVYLILK